MTVEWAEQREGAVQPRPAIIMLGRVLALGCLAFALVNVVLELTGHFTRGPLAAYATATSVMDWLVVGVKIVAAAVTLLVVARRPRFVSPSVLTALIWGAFALLAVYTVGNLAETVGMVTGLAGSPDQITVRNIGYVLFFLLGAIGYGVLAVSYSRRAGVRAVPIVVGIVGGPATIGLLLFAIPALLSLLGVLPAS